MSSGGLASVLVTSLPLVAGRLSLAELDAGNLNTAGQLSSVVVIGGSAGGGGQLARIEVLAGNFNHTGRLSRVQVSIPLAPVATVGPDLSSIEPWAIVTLVGIESGDPATSRSWRQISGPTVALSSTTVTSPTYEAPAFVDGALLKFGFTATGAGGASSEATIIHTVLRVAERAVVGGVEVPMRLLAVSP